MVHGLVPVSFVTAILSTTFNSTTYLNALVGKRGRLQNTQLFTNTNLIVYSSFAGNRNNDVMSIAAISENKAKSETKRICKQIFQLATLGGQSREEEQIMNILDLNVMPINVHALVKSVPLATVYNYCYTFEQMICNMFGFARKDIESLDLTVKAFIDSKKVFLKLLINPYAPVGEVSYGNDILTEGISAPIQCIFRGDTSLGLNTSAFLGKELYNKTLFGCLYTDYDEGGLQSSAGVTRGKNSTHRPKIVTLTFKPEMKKLIELKNQVDSSPTPKELQMIISEYRI